MTTSQKYASARSTTQSSDRDENNTSPTNCKMIHSHHAVTSVSSIARQTTTLVALVAAFLAFAVPSFGQGTIMPSPYLTVFDSNGDPVSGAKIHVFACGTTTEQDSFTSSALTTPNANPVVANAAGRATLWLAQNTCYKFVIADADDATIATIDNLQSVPTATGNLDLSMTAGENLAAGDVVYVSDGSGSLDEGEVYKADADNTYSSSAAIIVGMAPDAITAGETGTIRIAGRVTMPSASLSAGTGYYVSATAGALASTAPTNQRLVGIADTTQTIILRIQEIEQPNIPLTCEGRITLTSGTPVTTSDVTAAATVYVTPYTGNRCPLYDGATWQSLTFAEASLALGSDTTDTNYDLFAYSDSGTLTLERLAWTNDTTRATTLTRQDGVLTKTGDPTRRYLGTYRTSATGQTEDSVLKRFVWNYANRVPRAMRALDTTNSWTYSSVTIRQANASTANQLAFVIGIAEVEVQATVMTSARNNTGNTEMSVGIGEDTTTAFTTGYIGGTETSQVADRETYISAALRRYPAAGYHFWAWLEASSATGTTTFFGDNGGVIRQSGIHGSLEG